jgi:ribose-phosphate pyrophosphokinase
VKKNKIIIIGFDNSKDLARGLAKRLKAEYCQLEQKKFPDSETYLRFPKDIKGKRAIFVANLDNPDTHLIDLVFALHTARELKAKENILVAPYMPYMRQDKRFKEGECISSRVVAKILNPAVDKMYTFHPHLHRYKRLNELFKFKCKNLSLLQEVAEHIEKKMQNAEIVGPDIESSQWVNVLSRKTGLKEIVLLKERKSPHKVEITINKKELSKIPKTKKLVLFDDIISSGTTMINLIDILKRFGFRNINIICIHGIFADNSYQRLKRMGARTIISSNTIKHSSNKIDLLPRLAKEIEKDYKKGFISFSSLISRA